MSKAWVHSLVEELGPHKPCGSQKKKKRKKTISNIKFYYSNEVINLPSENNCKNI